MFPTLHPFPELRYKTIGLEAEACELTNKASELYLAGHSYEALGVIKRALGLKRCVPTLVNTAVILQSIGRFSEAFPYAKEAYEIEPEDENVLLLYAEALLRAQKYDEGWPLFYKRRATMPWLKFWLPEWTGQPVAGKRIVVIEKEECGVGDDLYFFRNVLVLRSMGAKVTFICRPSLVPLVEAQGIQALPNYGGHCDVRWPDYDYFCSILSLGYRLGIKWDGPYIKSTAKWWKKLSKKRVGFCWKAGEQISQKETRSLNEEQIFAVEESLPLGYHWLNLTYEQKRSGMKHGQMETWLATANSISTCSLVVTVDTAIGHLSGALGVPVWVVLPGAGAWCYPLGFDVHPFYPSMHIFRNPYDGMDEAINELTHALEAL